MTIDQGRLDQAAPPMAAVVSDMVSLIKHFNRSQVYGVHPIIWNYLI